MVCIASLYKEWVGLTVMLIEYRYKAVFSGFEGGCQSSDGSCGKVLWKRNWERNGEVSETRGEMQINEISFNEISFISALKNIQKFSHMMTKHKKSLISNRKKINKW